MLPRLLHALTSHLPFIVQRSWDPSGMLMGQGLFDVQVSRHHLYSRVLCVIIDIAATIKFEKTTRITRLS